MREYLYRVFELKSSKPFCEEEFYVNNKRYIVESILGRKENQEISKKMRI